MLDDKYLDFYGKVQDVLLGNNVLAITLEQLKELIEQYEK